MKVASLSSSMTERIISVTINLIQKKIAWFMGNLTPCFTGNLTAWFTRILILLYHCSIAIVVF